MEYKFSFEYSASLPSAANIKAPDLQARVEIFTRAQGISGLIYLRLSSLPVEGLEQLIEGADMSSYGLLAGQIKVFEKDASDGPEVWLSFSPQAANKTKLKSSPLMTSKILEELIVEFPAYQVLDRCCVHPPPSSNIINF